MERIRALDRYPKIILILLLILAVVFAAVYGFVTNREGYLYMDSLLIPEQQADATVYSGRLDGIKSSFTVTEDSVTFRRGYAVYGPYTLREDPTAIPESHAQAEDMWGFELLEGDRVYFRGALIPDEEGDLFDENGAFPPLTMTVTMSDGTVVDGAGHVVDPYRPSPHTILTLLRGPALTVRGHWSVYLLGLLFSAGLSLCILFADELFRFRLSFQVREPRYMEPSDWELVSRSISWTIILLMILWIYFMGLH